MHNSGLKGGNIGAEIMDMSKGTLLIRNERKRNVVSVFSERKIAFARMSKDETIRSIHVVWISPC
jgi:hypothetical protein